MNTKKIVITIIASLLLVLCGVFFIMKYSYQNKNIENKALIVAQQKSNEANFDKMKKLSNKLQKLQMQKWICQQKHI